MKTKTIFALLVFSCFMVHSNICTAQRLVPVESLKDWNIYSGDWAFSGNSATTTITVPDALSSIGENYEGSIGFQATVHINSFNGGVNCGIGKTPGYIGTDYLRANINVSVRNFENAAGFGPISCYLIRGNDTDSWIETYMDGYLGDWQYLPGKDLTVALSRVNNEVWYYVEGYGTRKFQPPLDMGEMSDYNWFHVQTHDEGSVITATIKDVYIIYPDADFQGTYSVLYTYTDDSPSVCWAGAKGESYEGGEWTVTQSGDTVTIRSTNQYLQDIQGTLVGSEMDFDATIDEHNGSIVPGGTCITTGSMTGTLRFADGGFEANDVIRSSNLIDCGEYCTGRTLSRTVRIEGIKQ